MYDKKIPSNLNGANIIFFSKNKCILVHLYLGKLNNTLTHITCNEI